MDDSRKISVDETTFQSFHQENVKLFIQFGMRFLEDVEVVRDLVQDAFVSAWERIETFNEEAHTKAFIYTFVRNRAINYLRNQKVGKRYQEELIRLENDATFVSVAVESEMYDILCKKIDTLSPMQTSILWMHVDGFSNEEIAEKLNISVNTVLTHKQRYKSILKSYLKTFSIYISFYI